MLRYLAIWLGLILLEMLLTFGYFSRVSPGWSFFGAVILAETWIFGLLGLIAKIAAKFAGKVVRKGARGVVRERRLAEQQDLLEQLDKAEDKRAVLKAYLRRSDRRVPIRASRR